MALTCMNAVADNLSRSSRSAIPLEAHGRPIHILDGKFKKIRS